MEFNVIVDPENAFGKKLSDLEKRQLPFAVSVAINRTAKRVVDNWKLSIAHGVDRPTAFTRNAPMMKSSKKTDLTAEVFLRDQAKGGRPPSQYMQELIWGGTRRTKGFEGVLQRLGALPPGMVAVPGKGSRINAFGNQPKGEIKRIVDALTAGKGDYFAVTERRKGLKPGVYRRAGRKKRGARPLIAFIRRPSYRRRLDLARVADVTITRHFAKEFDAAIFEALADAVWRGKA